MDYIDNFKKNHITGKNLFDLKEKELKDDLNVLSVGHRKNFLKSQLHLKRIFSKNKVYSNAIRDKLVKFYDKHKHQLNLGKKNDINNHSNLNSGGAGINAGENPFYSKFNSYFHSKSNYKIIEEEGDSNNSNHEDREEDISSSHKNPINNLTESSGKIFFPSKLSESMNLTEKEKKKSESESSSSSSSSSVSSEDEKKSKEKELKKKNKSAKCKNLTSSNKSKNKPSPFDSKKKIKN